jgi:signal transduction histidine kinase
VERIATIRSTPARPAFVGAAASMSSPAADPDLQTLLARTVVRIAEETGCACVSAWGRDAAGAPAVLAARWEGPCTLVARETALEALAGLARATDLGGPGLAEPLAGLGREPGCAAAAPVPGGAHGPAVFLLASGALDTAGRVRPRTLAALDAAAQRLAPALAAALAAQRLARLDGEVRRLDRLAALGQRLAEIVHEIRNPLVSVKTFLQLLPDRAQDLEFRQSFFEVASEELRRVERLLDVVLEHARPSGAVPEPVRGLVAPALASLARFLAPGAARAGVELEVDAPDALPAAAIGDDALRQVVLNLLSNALDAASPDGRVRLAARALPSSIEIRVEDSGPGIPPALRERIFEPFVSTRANRPGGLGLAIAKRIVEEAGGALTVEAAPGGGSCFRVVLRRTEPRSDRCGDRG